MIVYFSYGMSSSRSRNLYNCMVKVLNVREHALGTTLHNVSVDGTTKALQQKYKARKVVAFHMVLSSSTFCYNKILKKENEEEEGLST